MKKIEFKYICGSSDYFNWKIGNIEYLFYFGGVYFPPELTGTISTIEMIEDINFYLL